MYILYIYIMYIYLYILYIYIIYTHISIYTYICIYRQHARGQVREALCVGEQLADALHTDGTLLPPAAPPGALACPRVVTWHQHRQDAADQLV